LDLRHRVLIPGTFDCLDELYAAADLFLQPSACEAPPLALLAALAAGLPAIAADSPAIREAIEPEKTGLVFPAGDPKALAALIERLLAAPAEGVPAPPPEESRRGRQWKCWNSTWFPRILIRTNA
jgi:glycosyltransferase involved in cell wall biosynthesis